MNGIIHPCTHGNNEDEIVVLDESAMFKKIFGYVDRYVIHVSMKRLGLLLLFSDNMILIGYDHRKIIFASNY